MSYVIMLGGANANEKNGGAYDADGYTATWAECQDAGGAATYVNAAVAASEISAPGTETTFEITGSGCGTLTEEGVYLYVEWGTGSNYVDGRYLVSVTATADRITILYNSTGLTAPTGDDTLIRCGGAVKEGAADNNHLQAMFDSAVAGDTIKIQGDLTLFTTINIDTNSGAAGNPITIEGVDSNGDRLDPTTDTMPVITTGATLASGLILWDGSKTYYEWHCIDFNGGGAGKANYTINGFTAANMYWTWANCNFHNTDLHAVSARGYHCRWYNCDFYDAGKGGVAGWGMFSYAIDDYMIGCTFSGNLDSGLFKYNALTMINCNFYNNTECGVEASTGNGFVMLNCTIYGNTLAGFKGSNAQADYRIINCTSSSNGTYGFELNGATFTYFGYNHSYGNNLHWDGGVDGTWADAGNGNNITGDPLFVGYISGSALAATGVNITGGYGFTAGMVGQSMRIVSGTGFTAGLYKIEAVGSPTALTLATDPTVAGTGSAGVWHYCDDFTPGTGSPLLAAGFPPYFAINGDIDAITNYAHIGAVTRAEPSDFPDVGNVVVGDTTNGSAGTYEPALVADVQSGVTYGEDGTEFTGTFAVPAVGDVQSGVEYGNSAEFTGTFAVPAVGDVESGVEYGNSAEFTGTFTEPGVANVKLATQYGAAGTEFTGTYAITTPRPPQGPSTLVGSPTGGF